MVPITTPLNLLTYLVCLLGTAPLYLYLDPALQLLLPTAWLVGLWCDRQRHYWIGPRLATALSLVPFIAYGFTFSLTNLVGPTIHVLTALLCVRLVTEKQGRHYLQIFVLSLFCLASSTLLTLHLSFFPLLILLVGGITVGLVLLTFFSRDPSLHLQRSQLSTLLKTALILPTVSLLLMLAFFIVLPRTQDPLWNFLNPNPTASSGFSEEVRPGAYAQNAANQQLAFRVDCPSLPPEWLYWRGTVLNHLQAGVWQRRTPPPEHTRPQGGQPIRCAVFLPPQTSRFLFTLDGSEAPRGIRHRTAPDRVYQSMVPLNRRHQYQLRAQIGGQLKIIDTVDEDFYRQRPGNIPPRLIRLAEELKQQHDSRQQIINALKQFYRRQNLHYATEDLPGPTAPLDEFLFDKKRGYCEFFASSFALLLRLADVPARLVGGYHGGEYNELGGYYRVTEEMAHVWVEALVEDQWLRIDPSQLASNAATALSGRRLAPLSAWRTTLDGLDYLWTQAVLTYDLRKQFNLLRSSGQQLRQLGHRGDWRRTGAVLLTGIVVAVGGGWLWRRRHRSREQRLLQRYLQAVRRKHNLATIPATIGLTELAQRLKDPQCDQFATLYGGAIYRERALTAEEYRQLNRLIRQIKTTTPHSRRRQ